MDETTNKLMDKKVTDITVGDSLKIQAAIITVMVMVPVAILGVFTVADNVKGRLAQRKLNKLNKENQK